MDSLEERAKEIAEHVATRRMGYIEIYSIYDYEKLIADQAKRIEELEALECKYVDGAYFITSKKCKGLIAAHKDYKTAHTEALRQMEILINKE